MSSSAHAASSGDTPEAPGRGAQQAGSSSAWSATASTYTQRAKDFTLNFGKAALKKLDLQPGQSLLDVACGPGHLAIHAAAVHNAHVHAIDFSEGMIDAAKKQQQADSSDVTLKVMDGQNLEYDDGFFNAAVSCFGVFLFPDPRKGLSEMVRVLKPGAPFAISTFEQGKSPFAASCLAFFEEFAPEASPFPEFMGKSRDKSNSDCDLASLDGVKAALQRAGGVHVAAEHMPQAMPAESGSAFVALIISNPYLQPVLKRMSQSKQAAVQEKLAAYIDEHFAVAEGGIEVPALAIIGNARKQSA